MLARNDEMMDLLRRLDPVRITDRELGTVEIEVPIPGIGLAPELSGCCRSRAPRLGGAAGGSRGALAPVAAYLETETRTS